MIIDQLPEISTVQDTDEIPIERGTTTYKTPLSKIWARLTAAFGSNVLPNMDGTAAIGSSDKYARADHVHPHDNLIVRQNLLDNWFFVGGGSQADYGKFPINQRGQTSYNAGYCIDRWSNDGYVTTVINSDHIDVSKSASEAYRGIVQIVKASGLAGKTLTFSVLFAGTATGQARLTIAQLNNTVITDQYPEVTTANQFGVKSFSFVCPEDDIKVALRPYQVGHMLIKAVKLEVGDTQTLAHEENSVWVLNEIPNYSEELLKCQRYLVKFQPYQRKRADAIVGNSIDFLFPIPCTMASLPTSVSGIAVHLYGSTETAQTGFTFSATGQGGGYIQIRATKTSHGLTDATCYGTDSWYLSCEP